MLSGWALYQVLTVTGCCINNISHRDSLPAQTSPGWLHWTSRLPSKLQLNWWGLSSYSGSVCTAVHLKLYTADCCSSFKVSPLGVAGGAAAASLFTLVGRSIRRRAGSQRTPSERPGWTSGLGWVRTHCWVGVWCVVSGLCSADDGGLSESFIIYLLLIGISWDPTEVINCITRLLYTNHYYH